jgi:hypothetical protein
MVMRYGVEERDERRKGWSLRDLYSQRELPHVLKIPLLEELHGRDIAVGH